MAECVTCGDEGVLINLNAAKSRVQILREDFREELEHLTDSEVAAIAFCAMAPYICKPCPICMTHRPIRELAGVPMEGSG